MFIENDRGGTHHVNLPPGNIMCEDVFDNCCIPPFFRVILKFGAILDHTFVWQYTKDMTTSGKLIFPLLTNTIVVTLQ